MLQIPDMIAPNIFSLLVNVCLVYQGPVEPGDEREKRHLVGLDGIQQTEAEPNMVELLFVHCRFHVSQVLSFDVVVLSLKEQVHHLEVTLDT